MICLPKAFSIILARSSRRKSSETMKLLIYKDNGYRRKESHGEEILEKFDGATLWNIPTKAIVKKVPAP